MSSINIHDMEPFWESWYIDSCLGTGSYGSVYKVYKSEFGKRFYSALKVISIPKSEAEEREILSEYQDAQSASEYLYEISQDIFKEIQIMEELRGKTNIVSFEDHKIIKKPKGIGYFVLIRMELLTDLNEYIKTHDLTETMLVKLGLDLCTALSICEKRNIIHRDIKPANIFVSVDGDFKLGDFGIARRLEGLQTGLSVKGTYNYMAPEVYRGEAYDARVDIYSLGMVMYYYLNEKHAPFIPTSRKIVHSEDKEEALRQRFQGEQIPNPVKGSLDLNAAVLKACEFNRENRYKNADEFYQALSKILTLDDAILMKHEFEIQIKRNSEDVQEKNELNKQDLFKTEFIKGITQEMERIDASTGTYMDWTKEDGMTQEPFLVDENNEVSSLFQDEPSNVTQLEASNRKVKRICFIGIFFFLILIVIKPQRIVGSVIDLVQKIFVDDESKDLYDPSATDVRLDGKKLKDYRSIISMNNLIKLSMSDNRLTSTTQLEEAKNLIYLDLHNNKIVRLNGLKQMSQLEELYVNKNHIEQTNYLTELTHLKVLNLSENRIRNISTLNNLTELRELYLNDNPVLSDISVISNYKELTRLNLSNTNVSDITPLLKLTNLEWIDLTGLQIPKGQKIKLKEKIKGITIIE